MEESQLATFAGGELRAEGEIERKRRTCPSDRETGGRVEEGKKKGGGFPRWIEIIRTPLAPASTGMTQNKA